MSYYNNDKNVDQYIEMAKGYDGSLLINVLRQHLPTNSTVLELGMGPGKDLMLLNQHYQATGSDASSVFVQRFRARYPDADVIELDAITVETNRQFDAIYSNKVLYHLTREQLAQSLEQQLRILKSGGLVMHSFWYGDSDDEMHGLHFSYYNEQQLRTLAEKHYEVLQIQRYTEIEQDDSLYILLSKRNVPSSNE